MNDMRDTGYRVGYGLASDNLALGLTVIADSVNPLAVTREAWRSVAEKAACPAMEIEVTCSDKVEHRIISDGEPDSHEAAIAALQTATANGCETYGIGLNTQAIHKLLPGHSRSISQITELAENMFALLHQALLPQGMPA